MDQPAGTGFSYVTNPLGYVTNERTIGTELWTMLQEFYKKYPKYAKLDLYIVGESYGKENLHGMYLVCGGNVSGNYRMFFSEWVSRWLRILLCEGVTVLSYVCLSHYYIHSGASCD